MTLIETELTTNIDLKFPYDIFLLLASIIHIFILVEWVTYFGSDRAAEENLTPQMLDIEVGRRDLRVKEVLVQDPDLFVSNHVF